MQAATLEILENADLPPRQARAIAQAIELEMSAGHSALATRADLLAGQHGLEAKIDGFKHDLELKIIETKSELVRRVFLCVLGQSAMFLGISYFLFGHLANS